MKTAEETLFEIFDSGILQVQIGKVKAYAEQVARKALEDAAETLKLKSFKCDCTADGCDFIEGNRNDITSIKIDLP